MTGVEIGHVGTTRDRARNAALALDAWLRRNGWEGYDPYDVRALTSRLESRGRSGRALARVVARADGLFPLALRRLLRVRGEVNAKAMGLFAEAYRRLGTASGDRGLLARGQEALQWLATNPSRGYAGICWGYPFDWQSRRMIPRGTPSSVVTATAGEAFWGQYRATGDRRHLDVCRSICEFFLRDLNRDELAGGTALCFSYTPLDHFHVHNANLMVADFLVRVGRETGEETLVSTGLRAARYALSEQRPDGAISYWGTDQDTAPRVDHYHAGFEIRSLYALWKSTEDKALHAAASRYFEFYRRRLFENGSIPRLTPERLYPVDVHACAEAILCPSTLAPDFPQAAASLDQTVDWVLEHMRHPQGWFVYQIRRYRGVPWKLKVPHIRWGQAWMLRALAQFCGLDRGRVR
ncbi:MAG: hypothetical protein HY900_11075 [Deltaproteobacteria bacterium]|nr:hypothetical protein [Deltaproteobacteria bacterium]